VRHDAIGEDGPRAVDVGEEGLHGADPLDDPRLDELPLGRRDQARDQVQREDPLLPGVGEGDALVAQAAVEDGHALVEVGARQQLQRVEQRLRVGVRRAVIGEHLVIGHAVVAVEQASHEPVVPELCYGYAS
jgi:hypothetical protein